MAECGCTNAGMQGLCLRRPPAAATEGCRGSHLQALLHGVERHVEGIAGNGGHSPRPRRSQVGVPDLRSAGLTLFRAACPAHTTWHRPRGNTQSGPPMPDAGACVKFLTSTCFVPITAAERHFTVAPQHHMSSQHPAHQASTAPGNACEITKAQFQSLGLATCAQAAAADLSAL